MTETVRMVVVTGESGSGKSEAAQALRRALAGAQVVDLDAAHWGDASGLERLERLLGSWRARLVAGGWRSGPEGLAPRPGEPPARLMVVETGSASAARVLRGAGATVLEVLRCAPSELPSAAQDALGRAHVDGVVPNVGALEELHELTLAVASFVMGRPAVDPDATVRP